MNKWKELPLYQKFLIGILVIVAASLLPEVMILVDVGGLEMAFGFLLVTLKPIWFRLRVIYERVKFHTRLLIVAFFSSAIFQRRVFVVQTVFFCGAILVTGSMSFAMVFLFPGMLVNGTLL